MIREDNYFTLEIIPVPGIREVLPNDDLAKIFYESLNNNNILLEEGDIIVIAQKVVSKAEGRIYQKTDIIPSPFAVQISNYTHHDPSKIELILQESRRIVRMANGVLITQTHHGFIMANAGVDSSNSGQKDGLIALPKDPDYSAKSMKNEIERLSGKDNLGVIISDTFGRPWRVGHVNLAIGVAGMNAIEDYRGEMDSDGKELNATQIAVADELCSAAELVSGKRKRVPFVIIRNYPFVEAEGSAKTLVRDELTDIFR